MWFIHQKQNNYCFEFVWKCYFCCKIVFMNFQGNFEGNCFCVYTWKRQVVHEKVSISLLKTKHSWNWNKIYNLLINIKVENIFMQKKKLLAIVLLINQNSVTSIAFYGPLSVQSDLNSSPSTIIKLYCAKCWVIINLRLLITARAILLPAATNGISIFNY